MIKHRAVTATVLFLVACSGSPVDESTPGPSSKDEVSPTVENGGEPTDTSGGGTLLAVPSPEDGFQVDLEPFSVSPGQELYYCYRLPMPVDEDFDLSAVEARFSAGAHHLLLSTVDAVHEAGSGPCSAGEFGYELPLLEAMQQNLRFLTGTQTPYAADPRTEMKLDPGVAFRVRSASTILAQIHWVNTTTEVQSARTTINIHYAKTETVHPLDSFFFYNTNIELPPMQDSEAAARCTFPEGTKVLSMVSHMHARGTHFTVQATDEERTMVYEEDDWQEPKTKYWSIDDPLAFSAGTGIEYRCYYHNDTPDTILEGDGANEEMCMLIGTYTGGEGTLWGFPGLPIPGNVCSVMD